MTAPLRGILIARVSTKRQATADHFSIDAQFRAMRECCQRRGIEIVEERVEPGRSVFTPVITQVPVLNQTVIDIEAGMANCLVMHETTRLARNEQLGHHIMDRLTAVRAQFINSMMDIDYTTPEGRLFFSQEVAAASYSSRKTSWHSRKSKREKFLRGLSNGKAPFGYAVPLREDGTPDRTKPFTVVPEEAVAIIKAFEDYSAGANVQHITREWNAAKHVVRSTRGYDYWQPETLRDILRSRFYAGYVRHLDEYQKGLHEPIISEELFWSAQKEIQRVAWRTHPPKLLRGIATCIEGHRLRVLPAKNSRNRPDLIHYYYREPSTDIQRPCEQGGLLWSTKEPDAWVEELFRSICTDEHWLAYVAEQAGRSPHRSTRAERERIESKLERLQGEYLDGRIAKDKWDRTFAECQQQLASLRGSEEPVSSAQAKLTSWLDLWDNASPYAKNETCRLVFESAVIDFKKRELTVVPWPEFEALFDCRLRYVAQDSPAQGRW